MIFFPKAADYSGTAENTTWKRGCAILFWHPSWSMLLFTPEIDMPSVYIKKILLTNCFFFWISEVHRHFDREGVFGASRGAEGYIQLSGLVRHSGNHCLYCLYEVIKSPNALADQNVAISCHHMAPGDSNLFVILILRSLLSFLLLSGSCTERRKIFFFDDWEFLRKYLLCCEVV